MDHINFLYSLAGAFVGLLVGLTGVGGGSLMAPVLIILFGFSPAVAVGTDLWFACLTKTVGGVVHHHVGSPDWKTVVRLAAGSLPAAVVTLWWLATYHHGHLESKVLMDLLGVALLVTAGVMLFRNRIVRPLRRAHVALEHTMRKVRFSQIVMTVLGGAIVGALVTLTSVGAGALIAVMLALIYPLRLDAKSIVGTDIIHAIPLTFVAALGHSWLGNVDGWLLGSLLIGSIPGIVIGSLVAGKVNDNFVRYALAAMLVISAVKMIA
jgi:uncharacterized membrane protein YfcA